MRENQEKDLRKKFKSMRNHDVALAHLAIVNSMAIFVRDDDYNLDAFRGILVSEAEEGILVRIEFDNGVFSNDLYISESRQDQRMFRMLCDQKVLNIVYIDQEADIHRVIGSMNPLYRNIFQS